jgi:putative flippase GtrA
VITINIKALIKNTSEKLTEQLVKYLGVAVVALGVDYSTRFIYNGIMKIEYLVAAAIGFSLGLVVNYLLSMVFVFKTTGKGWIYEFSVFLVTGVIGLGLTELFNYLFVYIFSIKVSISTVVTTGIVFFFNFFARRVVLILSKKNI